jgi:hypothetical protein
VRRALRPTLALALCAVGCSYPLDALRAHDAGRVGDRPAPTPDLGVRSDVAVDLGAPSADTGAARAGSCDVDGGTVVPLAPPVAPMRAGAGVTLAFAMASNNLQGAIGLALPTGTVDGGAYPGCMTADPMPAPPTRIYRYQVVEGGTVTATTNTQHCTTFDTRVYAVWSCKAQDLANPAVCGDDLSDSTDTVRCPSCGSGSGAECNQFLSTIETPPSQVLRRGDVVFFAVTGFRTSPGLFPHRLWVGENAARIEHFPMMPIVPTVNRCVCQENTQGARTVFFPHRLSGESFPSPTTTVGTTSSSFLGVRDLPSGLYSGVGLQLRIAQWNLSTAPGCPREMVRAVFDLIVGGAMVTSFSIPATLAPPMTVTVPYTAFAPTMLNRNGAGMAIELRLREVQPQPTCLSLDLDPAVGSSAITLYGN